MTETVLPRFYTEAQVAEMLGISERTMQARRMRGADVPPYIQPSPKLLRYPADALRRWVEEQTISHTPSAAA